MTSRRNRPQRGWALRWNFDEHDPFLLNVCVSQRPGPLSGYSTAVFRSRSQAREHARRYERSVIGRPKVVPVTVRVVEG